MTNQHHHFLPTFTFLLVAYLMTASVSYSQDMQQGYHLLETGQFASAEVFFQEILAEYPADRTARLCYARAVGLHNDPARAISLFISLSNDYPEDKEVFINLAESYLWNRDYPLGQKAYETLYHIYPEDLAILVGLANSHALQKQYSISYNYLEQALSIDSIDISASTSMQYTRLGLAQEASHLYDYDQADSILAENLKLPVDLIPTYLSQANLALSQNAIKSAEVLFSKVVDQDSTNISGINGLSLTHYLLDHNQKSQTYSIQAIELVEELVNTDQSLQQATISQLLQRLIWNHDYSTAKSKSQSYLDSGAIDRLTYVALQSRIAMQQKRYKVAKNQYHELIKLDTRSTEGWIGIVQSMVALDSIPEAYKTVQHAQNVIGKHPTLTQLSQGINNRLRPALNSQIYYNRDSAKDQAINIRLSPVIPLGLRIALLASYQYRSTSNLDSNNHNGTQIFRSGLRYALRPNTTLSGQIGIVQGLETIGDVGSILSSDFSVQSKLRLQDIQLGYRSGLQDYNTNLINNRISFQTGYLKYSFTTLKGFGMYSELQQNIFSDENRSTFGLLSFYQQVKRRPFAKLGFNFQYLSFNESKPTTYFSPEQFYTGEVFVDIVRSEDMFLGKGLTYLITVASGLQFIDEGISNTYRMNFSLGYRWESGISLSCYGLRSNVATSSFGGFTYNEGGIKTTLYLTKNPLITID